MGRQAKVDTDIPPSKIVFVSGGLKSADSNPLANDTKLASDIIHFILVNMLR